MIVLRLLVAATVCTAGLFPIAPAWWVVSRLRPAARGLDRFADPRPLPGDRWPR